MAKFRSAHDHKIADKSYALYQIGEESMTVQDVHDSTKIDNIIKKYDRTGIITLVNQAKAMYGDFTTTTNEYQVALDLTINAQNSFAQLPSSIREKFRNDPGIFLEFATDPKNLPAMREMGLAHPAPEPVTPA